ncbi:MAG TPA: glutathione S-transferase family protein [Myxococcota bacterium]|nr:glutathione S-transferase family protein [Myxococcota bacterium]
MLTLYHAPMSRSVRVRWLLEELGIPHYIETYSLPELKRAEYVAIHPMGKIPTLFDAGIVLYESGAIVQYLLERYGQGRLEPVGIRERARFLQWIHFSEATLMTPLSEIVMHKKVRNEKDRIPALIPDAERRAHSALALVDRALARSEWLVGEFSAADIMMGYPVALASVHGLVTEIYPNLQDYLRQCKARPAFRRSIAT